MSHRLLTKHFLRLLVHEKKPNFNLFGFYKCLPRRFVSANSLNNYSKAVTPSIDILMQNIRSACDTSDVLYNIQQHSTIMNDNHVIQAMNTIFLLQKSQTSTMTNNELLKSDAFLLLCKVLKTKIRYYELSDQVTILKVLSFIGLSPNVKIMQIILHLVSKKVNELTLQQIVFVDFILKEFTSSPLVEALRIALPIVFEAQLTIQGNITDTKQLTEFFVFAIKKRLSDKCLDSILEKINQNGENLDISSNKIIVRTLSEVKRNDITFRNLLHQSLDNIVDNVNKYLFFDLNYILSRLTSNFHPKIRSHLYHEEFVDSMADYVIGQECDAHNATFILKSCNKFCHMHKGLLDYLSGMLAKDPLSLKNWSIGMLITFVNALLVFDYRPDNFDFYKNELVENLLKFTNTIELPWMRIALSLCSLDCWPHDLFNFIFDDEFLNRFLKRGNVEDLFELLQLYQTITMLDPSYQGKFPSESVMEEVFNKTNKYFDVDRSPLLPVLTHGLGGPSYLLSPAYTKLGHFIDHAVVMRKGGYPVAINNDKNTEHLRVEDLQIPEDSQIVLLLYLTRNNYTINTERIFGDVKLNMKTLEAMGFSVAYITESTWLNLLDNEKIPYIMQALQSKSQDFENVIASQT